MTTTSMMHLFLEKDSLHGFEVYIEGENFHYLKNVRRIKKGDAINAVVGERYYTLRVYRIDQDRIICRVDDSRQLEDRSRIVLSVYQGILKARKMDFVISKLAELGVRFFNPLFTERTVPSSVSDNRLQRWMKLAKEASKISGFERVMSVVQPKTIDEVCCNFKKEGEGIILVFSTDPGCVHIKSFLSSCTLPENLNFHLFFGPEGGFSPREVKALEEVGGVAVSMGNFIMKSETAAIVGSGFISVYYSKVE
jgi:16S rRNA (uracil1498-N3)-methyltransferase